MNVLAQVRAAGIRAEIFPDSSKMKKQMSYANSKMIPFVALVGENEMNEGKVTLKNMETGEQKSELIKTEILLKRSAFVLLFCIFVKKVLQKCNIGLLPLQ